MKYTLRRFGLSLVTLPVALVAYWFIYSGLGIVANSFASAELFADNLFAIAFSWVVVVTFSKQILDFAERIGN